MAIAYVGNSSGSTAGATSFTANKPAGVAVGHLIVAVYAFPGVAAGSGPWIVPNNGQLTSAFIGPATAWSQVCWQAPSASGVGIEVWAAIQASGATFSAQFATSLASVVAAAAYSGEYNPSGRIVPGIIRLSPTAQVTGDQPAAPSVVANVGELVIACGADLMTASQFGSPSGFTNRIDARIGGAGTGEATIADALATVAGPTGLITFPNAAATTTTNGTTATLVVAPVPTGTSVGPILDVPLPSDLDLGAGWTVRVTALDPSTGAVVPGVNVSNVALQVVDVNNVGAPGLESGDWLLVPGTGA